MIKDSIWVFKRERLNKTEAWVSESQINTKASQPYYLKEWITKQTYCGAFSSALFHILRKCQKVSSHCSIIKTVFIPEITESWETHSHTRRNNPLNRSNHLKNNSDFLGPHHTSQRKVKTKTVNYPCLWAPVLSPADMEIMSTLRIQS